MKVFEYKRVWMRVEQLENELLQRQRDGWFKDTILGVPDNDHSYVLVIFRRPAQPAAIDNRTVSDDPISHVAISTRGTSGSTPWQVVASPMIETTRKVIENKKVEPIPQDGLKAIFGVAGIKPTKTERKIPDQEELLRRIWEWLQSQEEKS